MPRHAWTMKPTIPMPEYIELRLTIEEFEYLYTSIDLQIAHMSHPTRYISAIYAKLSAINNRLKHT